MMWRNINYESTITSQFTGSHEYNLCICVYIYIMYASQLGVHLFNILLFIGKHILLISLLSF
jgi:hypothetical protein